MVASIYDKFVPDCLAIAAKAKNKTDKSDLLRLAKQWQAVATEQEGEVGRSAVVREARFTGPNVKLPSSISRFRLEQSGN
jgi:hypothetical protein